MNVQSKREIHRKQCKDETIALQSIDGKKCAATDLFTFSFVVFALISAENFCTSSFGIFMPISASAFHPAQMAMNLLENKKNCRSNGNPYANFKKLKNGISDVEIQVLLSTELFQYPMLVSIE